VSSATSTATGTGSSPRPEPAAAPAADAVTQALCFAAAIGIGGSILIMIVASAVKYSPAIPPPPWQSGPPLLELVGRLPVTTTYAALWLAVVLGAAGVMAGLAAVARGARFPARALITTALIVTAVFAVLPPSGSTDALSYATFGRIEVTGHNPYVMTPNRLDRTGDPIGKLAPLIWKRHGSVYGPLATMEETAAAELGGTSGPQIVFWLCWLPASSSCRRARITRRCVGPTRSPATRTSTAASLSPLRDTASLRLTARWLAAFRRQPRSRSQPPPLTSRAARLSSRAPPRRHLPRRSAENPGALRVPDREPARVDP
jgi:hypothetical protein